MLPERKDGQPQNRFTLQTEPLLIQPENSLFHPAFAVAAHLVSQNGELGDRVTTSYISLNPYESLTHPTGDYLYQFTAKLHHSDNDVVGLLPERVQKVLENDEGVGDLRRIMVLNTIYRQILQWRAASEHFSKRLNERKRLGYNRILIIQGHGAIENNTWTIGDAPRDGRVRKKYLERINELFPVNSDSIFHASDWMNTVPVENTVETLVEQFQDTAVVLVMCCNLPPYQFIRPRVSVPVYYLLEKNIPYIQKWGNVSALHNKTIVFDRGRMQVFGAEQVVDRKGRITYV